MNARRLSGVLLGVAFLIGSANMNPLSFSEMVGSTTVSISDDLGRTSIRRPCARVMPIHTRNTVKHEGPPERRPLCNRSNVITIDYNRRTSRRA